LQQKQSPGSVAERPAGRRETWLEWAAESSPLFAGCAGVIVERPPVGLYALTFQMLPFVRRLSKPELMTHLISARDLRASYGAKVALNGVSFDIEEGTSFALLGPNGAGKTTLINIL